MEDLRRRSSGLGCEGTRVEVVTRVAPRKPIRRIHNRDETSTRGVLGVVPRVLVLLPCHTSLWWVHSGCLRLFSVFSETRRPLQPLLTSVTTDCVHRSYVRPYVFALSVSSPVAEVFPGRPRVGLVSGVPYL